MCEVVISMGKNRGRPCREVNKQCRHRKTTCPQCGAEFKLNNTLGRHLKTCGIQTPGVKHAEAETEVKATDVRPAKIPLVLQRSSQGKNFLHREESGVLHLQFSVSLDIDPTKYKSLVRALGLEGARRYLFSHERSCVIIDTMKYLSDK